MNSGKVEKPASKDPGWLKNLDQMKADQQSNKIMGNGTATGTQMQDWYNDVKNNVVPPTTKATDPDFVKWLDKYAAEDVKSGKMTAAEADKWLK